jgi:hypothetical protein
MVADARAHRELKYVHPDDLRLYWDLIRPGLEKVKEAGSEDWILEDIYSAIKSGPSTLHIGYVNGVYVGFIVICPGKEFGRQLLHIWCLYLDPCAKSENNDAMMDFWPNIVKIAQNMGARRIDMQTARRGFERRLMSLNFAVNKLLMTYEVPE